MSEPTIALETEFGTFEATRSQIEEAAAFAEAPIVVHPHLHARVMACVDYLAANPNQPTEG